MNPDSSVEKELISHPGIYSNSRWYKSNEENYLFKYASPKGIVMRCITKDCPVKGKIIASIENMDAYKVRFQETIHSHDDDHFEDITVAKFKETLLEIGGSVRIKLSDAYEEAIKKFNPDEVAVIPCQEYFSSSFTRLNRKFDILKGKEPRNLNEILLNLEDMDELQIRSENFFSGHVTANSKTSLIFISPTPLKQALERSSYIYVDGTFKPSAKKFYQVITVQFCHRDEILPGVYILMEDKSKASYIECFRKLKELLPNFKPTNLMTDYEASVIIAFKEIFGSHIKSSLCFFHFTNNIHKRFQKAGLLKRNIISKGPIKQIKSTISHLSLLPSSKIMEGYELAKKMLDQVDDEEKAPLQEIFQYVEKFWFETVGVSQISCFGLERKTNNNIESYNRILGKKIGRNPSLYNFIGKLIEQDSLIKIKFDRIEESRSIRRNSLKTKSIFQIEIIRALEANLLSGLVSVAEFLQKVSVIKEIRKDTYQLASILPPSDDEEPLDDVEDSTEDAEEDYAMDFDGDQEINLCSEVEEIPISSPCPHSSGDTDPRFLQHSSSVILPSFDTPEKNTLFPPEIITKSINKTISKLKKKHKRALKRANKKFN